MAEPDIPAARGRSAEPRAARTADVTRKRLQDQLDWFDQKSGLAQRRFKQLKLATLMLGQDCR